MNLPPTVLIGHMRLPIRIVPRREAERMNAPAWFDDDAMEICVREELADAAEAEALCHEMLHALFHASDNHGLTEEQEERAVRALSPFLLMAIRDNPGVFEEMRKAVT